MSYTLSSVQKTYTSDELTIVAYTDALNGYTVFSVHDAISGNEIVGERKNNILGEFKREINLK